MDARTIKAIAKHASTDESRYQVAGIHREALGPDRTALVATDGRRILAVSVPRREAEPGDRIPRDLARKVTGQGWRAPNGTLAGPQGQSIPIPPQKGEFPDWRYALDRAPEGESTSIRVDARYLRDLCDAALAVAREQGGKASEPCSLRLIVPHDGQSMIRLEGPREGNGASIRMIGALMPRSPHNEAGDAPITSDRLR